MLAVLVNTVELLCTAGLPAVYTQILTSQGFPAWKNYAYLGLYISAYMLDDVAMLSIVVVTLSRRRLQEQEGRYLKLLSGAVILALGRRDACQTGMAGLIEPVLPSRRVGTGARGEYHGSASPECGSDRARTQRETATPCRRSSP